MWHTTWFSVYIFCRLYENAIWWVFCIMMSREKIFQDTFPTYYPKFHQHKNSWHRIYLDCVASRTPTSTCSCSSENRKPSGEAVPLEVDEEAEQNTNQVMGKVMERDWNAWVCFFPLLFWSPTVGSKPKRCEPFRNKKPDKEVRGGQQFPVLLWGDLLFPKLWQFGCQFVQVTAVGTGLCQDSAIPGTEGRPRVRWVKRRQGPRDAAGHCAGHWLPLWDTCCGPVHSHLITIINV